MNELVGWFSGTFGILEAVIIAYFLILNAFYLFLAYLSGLELLNNMHSLPYGGYDRIFSDSNTPGVSVLMPAYNEEVNVGISVKGILNLQYPRLEVVVINDGSTDKTLEVLQGEFRLVKASRAMHHALPTKNVRAVYRSLTHENLVVIDKENGGKADSLNAGINVSRNPYFLAIDADAVLEEDALLRVIRPVVEDPDRVVAVGGVVRIANGCEIKRARMETVHLPREVLPICQVVEYLRAFLASRMGFSRINGLLIISGAFGLFEKKSVLKVGGYRTDTVGEDMELVASLHELLREAGRDYRVVFICDPVCWTEAPATLKILSRQRRRWQRGLLEVLGFHKKMLFQPRYGVLGFFSFPFFLIFEGWGPVLEVAGYAALVFSLATGTIDSSFAIVFLSVSVAMGLILSLTSILLEELSFRRYPHWIQLARLVLWSVVENFFYRQMNTYFRIMGIIDYLRDEKGWGKMERRGIGA